MANRLSVVHAIPYDGIGGVEVAVRSIPSGLYQGLRFQKAFLACREEAPPLQPGDYAGLSRSENSPHNYLMLIRWLIGQRPQLLVASLWRCYIVLILYKLLRPRSLTVCFLHSPESVHVLDAVWSWLAMLLATEIWADSQATLQRRIPAFWHHKVVVMPLLLDRREPVTSFHPTPNLVFWGRLSRDKNLSKAFQIIHELATHVSSIRFWVVGPDGGDHNSLLCLVQNRKLESTVNFVGPKSSDAIAKLAKSCSFYLQTSRSEGMAISVVEAMQLGLVPVVTPVGEIANYCIDGVNAIFALDPRATALRILALLKDPVSYGQLRKSAILTWRHRPLYRNLFLERVRYLLDRSAWLP